MLPRRQAACNGPEKRKKESFDLAIGTLEGLAQSELTQSETQKNIAQAPDTLPVPLLGPTDTPSPCPHPR